MYVHIFLYTYCEKKQMNTITFFLSLSSLHRSLQVLVEIKVAYAGILHVLMPDCVICRCSVDILRLILAFFFLILAFRNR